jgi:hypothetical protein
MPNALLDNRSRKDSNRDTIELYLVSEEGAVQLSEGQEKLLKRWEYADELIRMREIRDRETQAKLIMGKFGVSRTTAYQDIVNAEAVFASSTPLNKKYRIGLRIEFLEKKIDELYGNVKPFEPDADDPEAKEDPFLKVYRLKDNEEYITQAINLEKVLQKYYDIYPSLVLPRSPRTIVYNIQQNVLPAAPMTAEEALRKAGKLIDITSNQSNAGAAE